MARLLRSTILDIEFEINVPLLINDISELAIPQLLKLRPTLLFLADL